jgi:hypothetical protein
MAGPEVSNTTLIEATGGMFPALISASLENFGAVEAPTTVIGLVISTAVVLDALRRAASETHPIEENDTLNT